MAKNSTCPWETPVSIKLHCITFSKGWIRIYKLVNNINKTGVTGSYATVQIQLSTHDLTSLIPPPPFYFLLNWIGLNWLNCQSFNFLILELCIFSKYIYRMTFCQCDSCNSAKQFRLKTSWPDRLKLVWEHLQVV